MKRFIAILIAAALMLSMTAIASAAESDSEEGAAALTVDNYLEILEKKFSVQLYGQDLVKWSWFHSGSDFATDVLGHTIERSWSGSDLILPDFNAENTADWTKAPRYALQIGCAGTMEVGESARYIFTVGDITISADGYDTVVIPSQELDCSWLGEEASWGVSGTDTSLEIGEPIRETLGLSLQQFCEEYLPAITNLSYSVTLDSYNLITLDDIFEFEAGLAGAEQEWIDTDEALAAQVKKAQDALLAAQADPENADTLADALEDVTAANNSAVTERENAGWSQGGLADTYIKDTFGSIVDEIQAMINAAAPAESVDEPAIDDTANEPSADDTTDTTVPSEASEGGSNTGLIIGIVVAAAVVAAAVVCAVVIGKKKK